MFPQPKTEPNALQNTIDRALIDITGHDPATDEFARSVDQIAKLHKMKTAEQPDTLARDTILLCATNIAGIVLIIRHEQFNNIATKAIGFVVKPK